MTSYLYPKRSETWLSWRNFTFKGTDSLFCLLNLVRHELVLNTFLDQHPLYNPISQSSLTLNKRAMIGDRNAKTNTHPSQPQKNTTHYNIRHSVHSNWLQICHLLCDWLEVSGLDHTSLTHRVVLLGSTEVELLSTWVPSLWENLHIHTHHTHTHTHTTHTHTDCPSDSSFSPVCSIPTI